MLSLWIIVIPTANKLEPRVQENHEKCENMVLIKLRRVWRKVGAAERTCGGSTTSDSTVINFINLGRGGKFSLGA